MLDLAAAIIKGLGYLGALAGAGLVLAGATLRGQTGLAGWVRAGGVLLVACACATGWLFIVRLGGVDDPAARDAVVGSPLGAALGLQMVGGLWLAAVPSGRAALVGAVAILASSGVVGHAATLGPFTSLTVIIHLMAAAWWLGGLLLLFAAGAHWTNGEGAALLSRFSRQAIWIVAALVLAAATTAALLLDWRFDPAQTYHRGIAAKAGLTATLIALAGLNRFVIVPRLTQDASAGRWLQRIIAAELVVVLGVLATTAWLTNFHSPHEASNQAAAPTVASQGSITILDAWSSPTLTSVSAGAGYMTLVNNQDTGDALIAASSPWAEAVTLHRSSMDGDIARMQRVDALPLPAHSHLSLAPGGYHLMLTGLYSPLVAGDTVPVMLTFQKVGTVELTLTVRPRSGAEEQHHH